MHAGPRQPPRQIKAEPGGLAMPDFGNARLGGAGLRIGRVPGQAGL
jgi:hypothetical protein